jgi:hypothetical protein
MRIYRDKTIYTANINTANINNLSALNANITNISGVIRKINGDSNSSQIINIGNGGLSPNIDNIISGTTTINIPRASISTSGIITTGTQEIGGNKTFLNNLSVSGTLNVNNIINNYICKITKTSTNTIGTTLTLILGLNSSSLGGFNNTYGNMYDGINSRINIVKTGKYNVSAWAGSPIATGASNRNYRIVIIKNGITPVIESAMSGRYGTSGNNYLTQTCSGIVQLNNGDVLTLSLQSSTANTIFGSATNESLAPTLMAEFISI